MPILLPLSVGPDIVTVIGPATTAGVTVPVTVTKAAVGAVADGDVLIAIQSADNGSLASMTANTGAWTTILSLDPFASSSGAKVKIWGRVASSEPTSWTWSSGGASDNVVTVLALRGVSLTQIVGQIQSTAAGRSRVTPDVDHANTPGAVMLAGAVVDGPASTTFTPPGDMNELADSQSTTWTAHAVAIMFAPADTTGTKTFTTSTTPTTAGVQWALVAAPAVTATTPRGPLLVNAAAMARAARRDPAWRVIVRTPAVTTSTAAEQGLTGAALVATGTAVKKVAQTGTVSLGGAATGTAQKLTAQAGVGVAGAVGVGLDKKLAVSTGTTAAGATATGLESTAVVATPRPAVTVLAAPRTPAYGRTPGARVVTGLPHGLATPAAEIGASAAGASATGTAVKVAKVVGTCSLAAIGVGTAKKSAPITSAGTAGAVITAVEKKAAAALGTATAGAAGTGTQTGAVTATRTPTVLVLTARRAPAYDRPGQVILGSTPAVDDPVTTTAELGRATVGATATGAVVKVAKVAGTCALATASTGTAKRVTAARGTATVGVAARHSGVVARSLDGVCAVATGTLGALRKNATPTGTAPVGAAGRGAQGRISRVVGLAALATSLRSLQARRSSVAGATTAGVAAVGAGGKRTGARGITCLAIIGTGRTFTPSAPIQGSPSSGVIVDQTTTRSQGSVLDQVPRRSATAVLDETEPLTGEGVVSRVVQHRHGGAADNITHFDTV